MDNVLVLPDITKSFEIQTYASDFVIGGVLLQEEHPIAYKSRKLNYIGKKFSALEKELLAILHCPRIRDTIY